MENPPSQVADAPKTTKTIEKPSTNITDLNMAEAIFLSVDPCSVMLSIERPDTNAIYPGISGSTQGDRNDRSPAENTISNDNSCSIINNIR